MLKLHVHRIVNLPKLKQLIHQSFSYPSRILCYTVATSYVFSILFLISSVTHAQNYTGIVNRSLTINKMS